MRIPPKVDESLKPPTHNFKFLRTHVLDISQEEYAEWLGVTRNVVNSYEHQSANVTLPVLLTLKEQFNIDLNYFLTERMNFKNLRRFFSDAQGTLKRIDIVTYAN